LRQPLKGRKPIVDVLSDKQLVDTSCRIGRQMNVLVCTITYHVPDRDYADRQWGTGKRSKPDRSSRVAVCR
jgi:hypothetical protein